jgi:hypothetical protein
VNITLVFEKILNSNIFLKQFSSFLIFFKNCFLPLFAHFIFINSRCF